MLMRRYLSIIICLFCMLNTSFADDANDCLLAANKYVYLITSASGTLELQKDAGSGLYTLTLHSVEGQVPWIKGAPDRLAGKISLDKFIALWDVGRGSFGEDPPDAELVSKSFIPLGIFSGVTAHAFRISNPRYDEKEKTLIFDAKSLDGKDNIKEGVYRSLTLVIAN